ncbi:SH3 domain-containing protein [Streptomyces sp. NPDC059740]|uniref:SH3 domain-containing protein n=1 Tax=Streptomyces sp. NPDC059740 TaxID=3346926 RepID=UPI003668C2BF
MSILGLSRRTVTALAMLVAAGSALATVPASAAPATASTPSRAAATAAAPPQGRVVSRLPLSIRERPTTRSTYLGALRPGSVVRLACKVRGENVAGNDLWYLLGEGRPGYVTARWVRNLSPVPWCPRR